MTDAEKLAAIAEAVRGFHCCDSMNCETEGAYDRMREKVMEIIDGSHGAPSVGLRSGAAICKRLGHPDGCDCWIT